MISMKFHRMSADVQIPTYGTDMSACFDLRFCPTLDSVTGYDQWNYKVERPLKMDKGLSIFPGDRLMLPTGLIFKLEGENLRQYSIRVHARSGLSLKKGLMLVNAEGIVDADYQQECFVLLKNTSSLIVDIEYQERIAQAEVVRNEDFVLVESADAVVPHGTRNGGFGSTGSV